MDRGRTLALTPFRQSCRTPERKRGPPMKLESLHKLWIHELKDLHSAETQLLEALPRMVAAVCMTSSRWRCRAPAETRTHVSRLEKIFKGLDFRLGPALQGHGGPARGVACSRRRGRRAVRDVAIIAACQRVNTTIAGYGTVAFASCWRAKCLAAGDARQESAADTGLRWRASASISKRWLPACRTVPLTWRTVRGKLQRSLGAGIHRCFRAT
jgi:ferritin-like metal-binding protein YciE